MAACLPIDLNAQDFYSYELFNKEFQAAFPEKPDVSPGFPKDIAGRRVWLYQFVDTESGLAVTASSNPSALKYDVGKYNLNSKEIFDQGTKRLAKIELPEYLLLDFSSNFDRSKNIYTAIYTASFVQDGKKGYISKKYTIYKKMVYQWSVLYSNLDNRYIFDKYQKYSIVIR